MNAILQKHILLIVLLMCSFEVHAQSSYVDTLKTMYQQKRYTECAEYSYAKWEALMDSGTADSITAYKMAFEIMPYVIHTKDYPIVRRINTMGVNYLIYMFNKNKDNEEVLIRLMTTLKEHIISYGTVFHSSVTEYSSEAKYAAFWPFLMFIKISFEINGLNVNNADLLKLYTRGMLELCYDPVQVEELLDWLSARTSDGKMITLINELRQDVVSYRNTPPVRDLDSATYDSLSVANECEKKAKDKNLPIEQRSHYALKHLRNQQYFASTFFHQIPLFGSSCTQTKYFEMDMPNEYLDSLADISYDGILYGKAAGLYSHAAFKQFVQDCGNRTLALEGVWHPTSTSFDYSDDEMPTIEKIQRINGNKSFSVCRWQDVRQRLKEHDIAVEFLQGERYIYALVLTKECQHPSIIRLCYRMDVKVNFHNIYETADAYNDIWKRIVELKSGIKTIYFSPCTVLEDCGIEYAMTPDGKFMCDEYNMYRLSNTRLIADFHIKRNTIANTVAFGGMQYNLEEESQTLNTRNSPATNSPQNTSGILRGAMDGIPELPGSLDEVLSITGYLNENNNITQCYTQLNATEENFKAWSGKDVSCIILSTHGITYSKKHVLSYDQESLSSSALLFSGAENSIDIYAENKFSTTNEGVLTAKEISEMDLRHVDMVILSACNSGVGTLMYGFKMAGVRTVLMSLQKVDDDATRILMKSFFRNLMNGECKIQSFVKAQTYLREYDNGKYNNPKYWAAFVMLDGLD